MQAKDEDPTAELPKAATPDPPQLPASAEHPEAQAAGQEDPTLHVQLAAQETSHCPSPGPSPDSQPPKEPQVEGAVAAAEKLAPPQEATAGELGPGPGPSKGATAEDAVGDEAVSTA